MEAGGIEAVVGTQDLQLPLPSLREEAGYNRLKNEHAFFFLTASILNFNTAELRFSGLTGTSSLPVMHKI